MLTKEECLNKRLEMCKEHKELEYLISYYQQRAVQKMRLLIVKTENGGKKIKDKNKSDEKSAPAMHQRAGSLHNLNLSDPELRSHFGPSVPC
jgi:hypothetical protein